MKRFLKPHLYLIALIGVIVPRRIRADWRHEWEAELATREQLLTDWNQLDWSHRWELLRRSSSAFWDALSLQRQRWEHDFVQDVRFGVRMLWKAKGFTALAVITLALGVGANGAIFSFMDALLLRPLPVREPSSLIRMTWRLNQNEVHGFSQHRSSYDMPGAGYTSGIFSYEAFELFRNRSDVLSGVFAYQGTGPVALGVGDDTRTGTGEYVSAGYFSTLGIGPTAGRLLNADDDGVGAEAVAVSFAFARRYFESPAQAVGVRLLVNNTPFTIVGVTPRGFFGTDPAMAPDVYLPLRTITRVDRSTYIAESRIFDSGGRFWLEIMARLQPGVSLTQAQAALAPPYQRMTDGLVAAGLWDRAPSLAVLPGADGIDTLRRTYAQPLYFLMLLAGFILAIACANVANLLLARASGRSREIAVRLGLGAGRGRLIRQLLTESVVLSLVGGAVGMLVQVATTHAIATWLDTPDAPFGVRAELNGRVLALTVGLSLILGIVFGLAPALRSTRAVNTRVTIERPGRSRKVLLVAQVAVTLVLLVAAGLFVRTLANYHAIDLGFSSDRILNVTVRPSQAGLDNEQAVMLFRDLRDRMRALPGVEAIGVSAMSLIGDGRGFTTVLPIDGVELKSGTLVNTVDAGFFETMQVPIVRGRAIAERDERPGAPPSIVVDETFARTRFPEGDALGRYVRLTDGPLADLRFEIVGVAANVRVGRLTGNRPPTAYFPFGFDARDEIDRIVFQLRTTANPLGHTEAVREIVRAANARVPITRIATQEALIAQTFNREGLLTRLCVAFAVLALTIAVVGLYGTVRYDVSRRRAEIGVRMALGARRGQVVWTVIREMVTVVTVGAVLGVGASIAGSDVVSSLLFGVTGRDPLTLSTAAGVLVAAAIAGAFIPARAAARISPTAALRQE